MPSVDDVLRRAFEPTDDDWARLAPTVHAQVVARHRRRQVVRRSVAAATSAAAVAAVAVMATTDTRTTRTEPATPPPSSPPPVSSSRVTALEGTWTSGLLDRNDVRAAARAAGASTTAGSMLDALPSPPFRVVLSVTGATLRTSVISDGAEDVLLDAESLSVGASTLELRPFGAPGGTVHTWKVVGTRLTMDFRSTTEPTTAGVPGEAWQRLLYGSVTFTR